VWPSPAQNGARDVAQAAINTLNILSHGHLLTKSESITVLPVPYCLDVVVGSSPKQSKRIRIHNQHLVCPISVSKQNWVTPNSKDEDTFHIIQSASGEKISVLRTDKNEGWNINLIIRCCEKEAKTIPINVLSSTSHLNSYKYQESSDVPPSHPVTKPLLVVDGCVVISLGSSEAEVKSADAPPPGFVCPEKVTKANWANNDALDDVFEVVRTSKMLIVHHLGETPGWKMDLKFKCCIPPPPSKAAHQVAPQSHVQPSAKPLHHTATSEIGKNAETLADAAKKALAALHSNSSKVAQPKQQHLPSDSNLDANSHKTHEFKSSHSQASGQSSRLVKDSASSNSNSHSSHQSEADDEASLIDRFGLAGDLSAVRKEIHASLGNLNSDAVVKLSEKIEASLAEVDHLDIHGINKADVAAALAKANAAAKDAEVSQEIADQARIAAAKSEAFLLDAKNAKAAAIAREQEASKAAAAATVAANDLKAKLAEATSTSLLLQKKADVAHAAYLAAEKSAESLKRKAAATAKESASAVQESKAAELNAESAKHSAKLASDSLAAAVQNLAKKDKELKELEHVVEDARKARDAAAAAAAQALKEAETTKTLNSAKLAAAHNAAVAAEADLKAKVAAAAVASRDLRVAGAFREQKQKLALAADADFVDAERKFKNLQHAAELSKKAADRAESESHAAAVAAAAALKAYLARQQSDITWPGKKPVLS
jgi:hypothetical protein